MSSLSFDLSQPECSRPSCKGNEACHVLPKVVSWLAADDNGLSVPSCLCAFLRVRL